MEYPQAGPDYIQIVTTHVCLMIWKQNNISISRAADWLASIAFEEAKLLHPMKRMLIEIFFRQGLTEAVKAHKKAQKDVISNIDISPRRRMVP